MDERPPATAFESLALTGLGQVIGAPCDPRGYLKTGKLRKFMGEQDAMAVVATGRALESAGLAGSLGERVGLYLAVGYIPFEEHDIAGLLEHSMDDSGFSMELFTTKGYDAFNPLLTFRCLTNMPAYHISVNFDIRGPYFVTYPGIGQWYSALAEACTALQSSQIDVALVGAVAHQRNFLVAHHFSRIPAPVPVESLIDSAGCI
ncbi:MAG: beta-ketoacyl synthase N-terminal-like domain-containing protein, partial [Candidatus Neomarinimicrobiota bacterium]